MLLDNRSEAMGDAKITKVQRFTILWLGKYFAECSSHKFGWFVLIVLKDHGFGHTLKSGWNHNVWWINCSRLAEGIDLVEEILQVIFPSQLVLEEFDVSSAKWSHGALSAWVIPVKSDGEDVVKIPIGWGKSNFILFEDGNIDHVVGEECECNAKVHEQNQNFGTMISSCLQLLSPRWAMWCSHIRSTCGNLGEHIRTKKRRRDREASTWK